MKCEMCESPRPAVVSPVPVPVPVPASSPGEWGSSKAAMQVWFASPANLDQTLTLVSWDAKTVVVHVTHEDGDDTCFSVPSTGPVLGIETSSPALENLAIESFTAMKAGFTPEQAISWAGDFKRAEGDGWGEDEDDGGWGEDEEDGGWGDANLQDRFSSAGGSYETAEDNEVKSKGLTSETQRKMLFLTRQKSYEVYDNDIVAQKVRSLIQSVTLDLGCTPSCAMHVLRCCNWDPDRVLALYNAHQAGEPAPPSSFPSSSSQESKHDEPDDSWTQLSARAGVDASFHQFCYSDSKVSDDEVVECQVCCEDIPYRDTFALPCKHRFCLGCWRENLTEEVINGTASGESCLQSRCPWYGCKESVGEEVFEMLCSSAEYATYTKLLYQSYIDDNNKVTWCPAPGCEHAIGYSEKQRTVSCMCGHEFCFTCSMGAHAPSRCEDAKRWRDKDEGSNSLDMKFLTDNCKPCPFCKALVKKEGGCMYISCRCGKNWCWHCGKGDHHVWECDRTVYDAYATEGESLDSRQRYLHFYERFFNHKQALKATSSIMKLVTKRMKKLVKKGYSWEEVSFVETSTLLLLQCRRVLAWSYVRAFYIKKKETRRLLEFQQAELEKFTEMLNQLLEKAETDQELLSKRQLATDYSHSLYKAIHNLEYSNH
jgi:hypothetical protein